MILFESQTQLALFLVNKGVQSYGLHEALTSHFVQEAGHIGSVELKEFLKDRYFEFIRKEQFQWRDDQGNNIEIRVRLVDITIKEETEESNYEYESMIALDCNSFSEEYFTLL